MNGQTTIEARFTETVSPVIGQDGKQRHDFVKITHTWGRRVIARFVQAGIMRAMWGPHWQFEFIERQHRLALNVPSSVELDRDEPGRRRWILDDPATYEPSTPD